MSLHKIDTSTIAVTIVRDVDFFIIAINNGIRLMPADAALLEMMFIKLLIIIDVVNLSSKNGFKLLKMDSIESINIFDKTIDVKVNITITKSFDVMSFFLFMGYVNNTDIVFFLYSFTTKFDIKTAANIIKTAFINEFDKRNIFEAVWIFADLSLCGT